MPPLPVSTSKFPPQFAILILLEPRLTAPLVGLIVTPSGRSKENVVSPSLHWVPAWDIDTGPAATNADTARRPMPATPAAHFLRRFISRPFGAHFPHALLARLA